MSMVLCSRLVSPECVVCPSQVVVSSETSCPPARSGCDIEAEPTGRVMCVTEVQTTPSLMMSNQAVRTLAVVMVTCIASILSFIQLYMGGYIRICGKCEQVGE